jgi:hypothetical protein
MNQLNRYYLMHGKPRVKPVPRSLNATDVRDDRALNCLTAFALVIGSGLLIEQAYAYVVRPAPVALVMTKALECREKLNLRVALTRDEAFGLCPIKGN